MLGRLFGRKGQAQRDEDHVWVSDAAHSGGVAREVGLLLAGASHAVVVGCAHDH